MQKFNRNYKIYFEVGRRELTELYPEELIEVSYPFTMSFDCSAGINLSSNGNCKVQLYNLPSHVQKALWKDNWYNEKYILMQLHAGYGDTMPLVFFGFVNQCYSYRNGGSTEYITEIQADDNSLISMYGFSNVTFSAGTKPYDLLEKLLEDVNGYKLGYLTPDLPTLRRDKTFIGQTLDLLGKEYGAYEVFIDKGELNILGENDVIPADELLVITPESGLLGSPKRADQFLKINMIFEPRARIGQAIELQSESLPFFNGLYKIYAISHKGIISPVQCGNLVTELTLSMGNTIYQEIQKASAKEDPKPKNVSWQRPLNTYSRVSSYFGYRDVHPVTKGKNKFHSGMDLAAPLNTPVIAAAEGDVTFANWNGGTKTGYGRLIIIDHGGGLSSYYAHLNEFNTEVGAHVNKGQEIGKVGQTGYATGAHLHFEIRENKKPVDPRKYINF